MVPVRRWQALLLAVFVLVSLAGCAARSKAERAEKAAARNRVDGAWPVMEYADYQTDDVDLKIGGRVHTVAIPPLRVYAEVAMRLSVVEPDLAPLFLIVEGRAPNAYSLLGRGHPIVAVNLPMVEVLGTDEAMWAAVVGHEMAHLSLDHQSQRRQRTGSSEAAKGALAIALAIIGIPFGILATDTAVTAVGRSYSRDDERAADALGVDLLREAGFDPRGALRFQERMAAISKRQGLQFLSTHPTWDERIEYLRQSIDAPPR